MKLGNNIEIGNKAFIIAEIGTNHNGDFELAKKMLKEAASAGADGVKFQTFNPDNLIHKALPAFSLVKNFFKTQYERIASLQFTYSQFRELKSLADEVGVIFLSTPFDEDAVEFLDEVVPFYKVASGDINHIVLLRRIAVKNKLVILSTGMANEEEIQKAIDIFPKEKVILLHCVSHYPTPLERANLLSISYLRDTFKVPVGYSDHTVGLVACKVAASLGAVIIEKHFTLDKSQAIGDHRLSMDSADLACLVQEVRDIEKIRGGYGKPIESERSVAKIMRRSLYAKMDIPQGVKISKDMIAILRPADGLPPEEFDNLLGKTTITGIKKDALLTMEMFK